MVPGNRPFSGGLYNDCLKVFESSAWSFRRGRRGGTSASLPLKLRVVAFM